MYHFGIYKQALLNSKDKVPNYIIIIELSMKFLSSSVRRGPGSSRQPAVQLKADPSQLGIQTCSLTHSLHNVQLSIQKHFYWKYSQSTTLSWQGIFNKGNLDLTKTFLGRLNKIGMFKGLKTEKYEDLCSQKKDSCGKIKTSQELRMLSRSLSDCKSLLLNIMIQVSQFIRNGQLCH